MKSNFYSIKFIFASIIGLVLLSTVDIFAQSATTMTAGASPTLSISGSNYQAYCVEYTNNAPPSSHGYNWDSTPEDITNDNVTACLRGHAAYGTSAVQNAIWYYTDNVSPSSGSNAWEVINRVNNGTYQASCASEWYPNDVVYQDLMTSDDPHCSGGSCVADLSIKNNGCCNVGIYLWKDSGDEFIRNLAPGEIFYLDAELGGMYRAVAPEWEPAVFDDHYTVSNCDKQAWNFSPNFCEKSIVVNNNGCCDIDLYHWQTTGDVLIGSLHPGESTTVYIPSGDKVRAIDPNSSWDNLLFDDSRMVPDGCGPFTFDVSPNYCDKEVTVVNDGCCDLEIYHWQTNGDILVGTVTAGNSTVVNIPSGDKVRVRDPNSSWDNALFDDSRMVPEGCGPFFFNVNPEYCAEIFCPADITIKCNESVNPNNTGSASGNCGNPVPTYTDSRTGSCPEILTRTWTYTGGQGYTGGQETYTCDQIITIVDDIDPGLQGLPNNLTVECNALPAAPNVTADDACNSVNVSLDEQSTKSNDNTSCNAYEYIITRVWTATDACGNSVSASRTITVEDTQAPVITQANSQTVECDGEGNDNALQTWLNNNGGATANDNCSPVTWTNNYPGNLSNECGETGDVTVTFTASDVCGNTNSTTASFTIEDAEGPVITAANQADDLTVECDGLGNTADLDGWIASNGGASASDVCGGFEWSNDFDALNNECCETGDVTVNFTATDDCGNSTVTTATFTIEDTTPPVPVCKDITIQITDVASHTVSITPDMIENGSSDVCCDDELTFELSQSTFAFEEVGVNPITMTVTDACGNSATCNANVTVVCYDLALTKTLAAGQDEIIFPEEDVTFTITVLNQGTIEANSIEITDYIPSGLTLNDAAWTLSGNTATYNMPGSIAPGASASVNITFTAATQLTNNQQIINRAEISSSDAPAPFVPVDEDSVADDNEGNDAGGDVNTNTDDSVNNEDGDEDDSDPEDVTVNTMSIGSTVFLDNNNNGIQDTNDDDTGIEGVVLELWRDGALVATTTTDANGDYLFEDLAPGNYEVEIKAEDNFEDGDALDKFHVSSDPTDNADNQEDGDDNGMQPGGSATDVKSPVITLSPNDEPTGESGQGGNQDAGNDDNGDMTIDFGFIPEFSIGSNVFVDANNNGIRDAGEEGIEGILVEIFSVGPDGIAENADDVLVGSDVTDANGDYFVGWLKPGDYYGKIDNVSEDYPTSSDDIASTANPNNDTDSDDNGLQPDGRGAGVWSNVITLSADDEPTNEPGSGGDQDVVEDDDNGNMTLDFGFRPELSIGSNVFVDANDNGTRDAGEEGIEGILVEIFNTGADGIAENADDQLVGSDVTDANGDYFVDGLLEGDYYAKIMDVSDDYPKSSSDIASSADPNNNTDGDDNGLQPDGPGAGVWSNVITLTVNDEPTNEAGSGGDQDNLDDNNGNMTLDFGFAPQLSIGSNVFYDANDNGVRDAGEEGIEGVTVEVFNTGADGIAENADDQLVGSDVTDSNGDYYVDGLLEGDFYVKIMNVDEDYPLSSGDTATTADPNNNVDNDDNGLQPDGSGAGVWSNVITLSINDEPTNEDGSGGDQDAGDDDNGNMTVDFGFRPELSIGSNVYSDTNNNGVRDAGEEGIEGVTVEVFNTGADGIAENADDELVGTDITDANGDYFVDGLLEGDYYAKIMIVDADNPTSSTDIGSSADPNNDTDGDDNGLQPDGSGAGVWSNVITLSINDEPTNEAGSGGDQDSADDNNGNMTLDFGFNRFDLALNKTLNAAEDERVYPGEDITFDITVFNQGNVDAYNVLVTDYIPSGLTLNDAAWSQSGSNATITIPGPIAAGSSETISITLTVATTNAGDLVNSAEITSAEDVNGNNPEDVDSDADDTDGNDAGGEVNGPTDDTVNNENGDEDDQDPEDITVEIFDLALAKTLSAGSDDRIYPGETVSFDITVTNQGTVPAQNIVIEDYAPAGLTATGATTLTIVGPLAAGASEVLTIEFVADPATTGGQLINVAEIASAEDELGDNPTDLDSTPDSDPGNDPGGEVNGPTDDTINNEGGDEDDSDSEDVFLEIFDLALVKTLAVGEDARVYPGETITFDIEVFNQGTVPASNIVVEDFGAPGLTNNGSSTLTIAGPIAAGSSETVQVTFTVDADAAAGISTNIAEIQSSEDDLGESPNDNDSTEDSDPNNDPTEDNAVDNENGDEDDNDPEDVDIQIFDLALRKTLAAGEDARVYPGETVTFTIEVFNQGTVAASNIVIEDYVPAGLTATGATTLSIAGPIAPGASESVDISFVVSTTDAGTLENGAEIQSAEDDLGENPEDIDSTPDGDDSNDPTDDNSIDGENGDEDDDDIEPIEVEIFDLASNITLAPGEDDRVYPGETVSFKVTVFNQGTVDAENIEVTLMIPDGLTSVDGIANMGTIVFDAIAAQQGGVPGMSMQILEFVVGDDITEAGELVIKEEITSAQDEFGANPTDIDSTPDADFTNDAGGVVDSPTDDTIDNENGDEDDNDPENVFVEIFDLALIKTLSAGEDARVYPGETVSFDITVTNQGTVPASDILITDYVPAGLTANGPSAITIAGPLAPGASEVVSIEFTVDAAATDASLVNRAEITDYRDDLDEMPEDIDSVADSDDSNDTEVNDVIDNTGGDEDDADLEELELEIFDLALTKKLATGEDVRVYPGETVTFTIEVTNQGTVPASNIVIEDYVPAGLTATGATSLTIAGPIAPEASESVDISFVVSTTEAGTLENGAEIQSAEDDLGDNPEDNDSTADNDPDNDPTTDDAIDGENGDEDDDDIEPIEVEIFDLASNITLAPGEDDRVYPGETVSFKVTVFNQGTVDAENIEVTLMIPDGLTSVDGIANMGTIVFDAIAAQQGGVPGMSMQILEFVVGDDITEAGELVIKEEITSAQDEFGANPTDIDSTPDADFTNDAGGVVDSPTDDTIDNEQGDEDDNDPENVFVEIFDLALIKTLSAGEDARVYPGDAVSFDITVTNQGSVPATNIIIEDYVPAGLTATSATTITLPQLLLPGESATVPVTFTVNAAATAGDIVNRAEIIASVDDLGGNPDDIDSTEDSDDSNDTEVNDVTDNSGGDEDDADLETLELEIFDLALTKKLAAGEDVRVYPGETVTFTIEVTNQGTVPASNIVIEDYVPAGLTATGATSLTIAGPIAPEASESVDISFVVSTTEAGTLENGAEIQSAEDDLGDNPEDNDSTADNDPDNDPTTDDAIDGENGDEDDDDIEPIEVEIFDLASNITLAPGEDDRVYPGETVSFKVTVFNQGTVDAENIEVTLMIPDGLTSVDGIANMGTIVFDAIAAQQGGVPGMSMQILEFVVGDDITEAGELVIKEEITSAQDEFGANPTDIDSTPDADFTNDAGGVVDSPTDDTIDNEQGDEDDNDPENVFVEIFDLALTKKLAAGEDARVYPGETVTFTIEVTNQGSVPASNVVIEDYVPAGLTATGATSLTIAGPIAPEGGTASVDISFVVSTTEAGTLENGAEIQSAEDEFGDNPEDIDSVADNDPDNDPTTDDAIDGENGDEDDDDIEPIEVEIFDLASNITLAPGEDDRVYPGETVSFKVTVFNQGTVDAENIEVTLMIPDGLTSVDGIANMGTIVFDAIAAQQGGVPGMSMQILEFVVGDDITEAGELVIKEEITSAQDEFGANPTDIDSTPDADFTNDAGGVVDSPTDDTIDNEQGDEDDNDPENVFVEIFDLALTKKLAAGEDARVYPGETVTFTIEVTNQGSVPASNVVIEDYVPAGLTATGATSLTIAGPIAPEGGTASVDISFVVSTTEAGTLENGAEIQSAEDEFGDNPEDIDSVADNDPDNDPTTDDAIDGENGDEDDDDIEPIEVEIFDLASNITLAPGEDDRVYPGETVSFKVTVFNQGTVDAENIEVTLMIPDGLTSVDGIANMGTIVFDAIAAQQGGVPGMSMQILEFVVGDDITEAGELVIKEEITSAQDEFGANPTDIDSTPDADFTNDAGGIVDSNTDDTILNENGDEDDNDPENVFVEIFDLALTKTTNQTEIVKPGDDVTYTITVLNQGSVAAENIQIIDYLPNFFTLSGSDTNGWTTGGGTLSNTLAGPLAPGASATVDVVLTVQEGIMSGTADNFAEITSAQDEFGDSPEDVDSTPDSDNNNDNLVDNEVNNAGGDEDDHDIETIEVCDNVAPVLAGVPSDIILECSDEIPALPVIGVEITATDFSNDEYTITVEETSTQGQGDDCSNYNYEITRVWTVVDECDNSSSATQVITIQDTTAPNVTTEAANETVECDGQGNVAALQAWLASNGGAIAEDNCSEVSWTNDAGQLSEECGMTGFVSVIFTAVDECGNTTSTTATFTIEDTSAPTIDTAAADETVECDGQGNAAAYQAWLASNGGAIASDVCSDNNITWTNDAGQLSDDCGATGFVTVNFTATDDCGNSAVTTATFTIEDTTAPVITAAADETVECDGQGNVAAYQAWLASNGGATATDDCSDVTITNDGGTFSDDCGATGFATVTFTATDDCGNSAVTSATFTIEDTTAPVITASASDETVECDGQGNVAAYQAWLASNGGAAASDDCGGVTFTNDAGQLSDDCGATGFVTVNFTATDDCGNSAVTSATFTIEDTTAPVIDTPAADEVVECDGQGNVAAYQAWLASNAGAAASDDCGGVTFTNDAGQLSDDCGATGFITVNFTATDDCGNSAVTSATFTIEDTTAPVIDTPAADEVVECDGQGNVAAYQAWLASNGGAAASDDCGGVTFTNDAGQMSDDCGATGFVTVNFTATDDCGNSAVTSATFTIEDTTAPVIDTPAADEVVECDGQGNVAAYQAWLASNGGAAASDDCGGVTFTNDAGQMSDDCGATGFITVNFTATDDCGNSAVTSATFTIEDTNAPDVTVEASNLTVECDGQGNIDALQAWLASNGGANAIDGCGEVTWSNNYNITNDDCGETGAATVTFTATDECGNASTTSASFVIEDTTAPEITDVPSNLDVECDEIPAVELPSVSDACDDSVSIQLSESTEAGDCPNSYIITRTFTATDACGNSSVATQTINVGDSGAPTLSGIPSDIDVECDEIPDFPAQGEITATDNCDPNVSIDTEEIIEPGACEENYTIVRRWIATDACGNTAVAEQRIAVGDNTAPVLAGIPANITVECDEVPNTSGAGNVTATDNCDANVEISYEESREDNAACADAYTIVRTWIASDNCGNSVSAEQRITVGDNTAPVLVGIPSDLTVECDEVPSATNGNVLATDNCDDNVDITFIESIEAGACADAYTIIRTWTATDNCGNETSDTQRIDVGDNTPPMISGVPANLTLECDEVASATAGNIQVTDNCDSEVEVTFEEVREDNGACPDAYTIVRTWIATDNCGNAATGEQRITVGDNTEPVLSGVPADVTVECSAIPEGVANVQATDNCDSNVDITLDESITPGECQHSYVIVKTWTAVDNCGNETAQQQRITVEDTTAPVLSGVPSDVNAECGQIPNSNGANDVSASDNCDSNPLIEFDEAIEDSGDCADAYVIVRTWTATDACGNATTAEQRINVGDNTPPVLVGIPSDQTVECDNVSPAASDGITAMDNCDSNVAIEFSEATEPGNCSATYTLVRTWIATDNCGNTAIGTQRVSVGDNTAPVISGVDADITIDCGATPPAASNPQVTDNCDANVQVEFDETSAPSNDCTASYSITRTWTATDDCGNVSQAQQVITVSGDNTAPTLVGVPNDANYECNEAGINNVPNVTATDNCDANVSVTFDELITPGACAGSYAIIRTWIATDDCGNSAVGTQTINVNDVTPPTIVGAPSDIVLDCGDTLPQEPNVTATDNCDANVQVEYTQVINGTVDCQNSYTVIRTWTASDACGNESVATQTITITGDNTAPTLVGVPSDVSFECGSVQDVPQGSVTATDNCDANVSIDYSEFTEQGDCPQAYTLIRTWIATDDCGNTAVGVQNVSVGDGSAPTFIGVPADISIECGETPPAAADVTAIDNCSANVDLVFSETSGNSTGDCTASYTIVRTWSATDECGNAASASQTITVGGDNSLPTLVGVPADANLSCNEAANIPNPNVTATDNCDDEVSISMNEVINEGNCPGAYTIVRTWTATDDCGNSIVDSQTINVSDADAPVIAGVPGDISLDCGESPNNNLPNVTATDTCDDDVSINFDEVRNEGDCSNTYTLVRTWTATDDCGNVSTATQTVSVGDNEGPVFSEVPNDLTISCTEVADIRILTATDNCGRAEVTYDDSVANGNCAYNSTITRTYTATDECGNVTTAIQHITISDNEAPVCVGVPSDITVDASAGQSIPDVANVIATDNCDPNPSVEFTSSQTDGCSYVITRTWTVTDACGNAATCTQNITVNDELDAWLEFTRDENCDDMNGAAVFAPANYNYAWSDNGTGAVREDLADGTYTVTATDGTGCSIVIPVVIAEIGNCDCEEPNVTIVDITDATCGDANGSIELGIANAADFTYTWIPNIGSGDQNIRTGLPGGMYEVVISDLNFVNCFTKVNFVIGNSDGPDVTDIQVTPATCGESNGSVIIAPASLMYMWSADNFIGNTRSDLAPGVYEVAVMDPNNPNCPSIIMVEVTGTSELNASANILAQPTCGESNGSVQIAVANGDVAGLSFSWNDGATGNSRDNLTAGTYTVVVSDAAGCQETLMFILMDNVAGATIAPIASPTVCFGDEATVAIDVTPNAGFAGQPVITIVDENGVNAVNGNLTAGGYCVMVADANGCIAGETCFVVNELPMLLANATATAATCTEGGSIDLTVSGGATPYTISWSTGVSSEDLADLAANQYTAQITDANGCTVTVVTNVGDDCTTGGGDCELDATLTIDAEPTCNNADGAVTITITGGTASTVAWPDGSSELVRTDLAEGNYAVTITDASVANCVTVVSVVLSDDADCGNTGGPDCELSASVNIDAEPTCDNADGAVTITITGGTASTVAWPDGSSDLVRTDLAEGSYAVTITDASVANCETVVSIVLSDDADCDNGGGEPCDGTLTEMTSDCEGNTGYICLDIPKSMYHDYHVEVDGQEITEPSVLACNFSTIIRYDYSVLLDGGFKGPYEIQSWIVNGVVYSGTFQNILEILDFMNDVDPTGNWMIDRDGQRLLGGNPDNNYGDFFIDQLAALNSQVQMGVNTGSIAMGSAIGPFDDGVYTITVIEPNATCPDTILLTVTCDTDTTGSNVITDVITVNTTVATAIDVCTDNSSLSNVASVALCGGPQGGSLTDLGNGCYTYTPGPGLFAGDSDQFCITVCDDTGACVETTVNINILDEDQMPCADGLDILGDDITIEAADCAAGAVLCTSIDVSLNNNYNFYINGTEVTTMSTCDLDTMFNYSYFNIANEGFSGTYTIDSWTVDGQTSTGSFTSAEELAAFLNANDASGNWTLDATKLAIYGGDLNKTYGMIEITRASDMKEFDLYLNSEVTPNFIAFDLPEGSHTIIASDVTFGCADTLNVIVECPNPLNNPSWTDTINLVLEVGVDSLYCYPLAGNIATVDYTCLGDNSGSVDFSVVNECILLTPSILGTDIGCFTICDTNGECGTLIINTEVLTAGQMAPPVAMDDDTITVVNVSIGTVNVLINDLNIDNLVQMSIVSQPQFGTVVLNADNTFTYTPDPNNCGMRDEFQYMITTTMGSDIATVYIDILCEELTVMNGFSPNGDNLNDTFTVLGLERYPNNEVIIFNRWGNQVYHKQGYTNQDGWRGTWEGQDLPDGTYFYIINTGEGESLSGYVQIQR